MPSRTPSLLPLAAFLALPCQFPGSSAPPLADDKVASLVLGEFTGDTNLDAVVIAEERPVVRISVETHQTYLRASVPTVDLARLPGTGLGGRDRIVTVGPEGLDLLEILDVPSGDPWQRAYLRGPGTYWASALAVRTGQVDGLHGDDIVAVTPSRVLVARSNGAGGWLADETFLAGAPITGVELVDWDGQPGGDLEIAILLGRSSLNGPRLRLASWNGTFLMTMSTSGDELIGCPMATAVDGPRWLAIVSTSLASGGQELVLIGASSASSVYALGAAGVQDCVAGDWDGDGIDDLVLSSTTARDSWLRRVVVSGPLGLALDPDYAPPAAPIALPVGHPDRDPAPGGGMDIADVDHDGDLDLVTAMQGSYTGGPWSYLDPRFSEVCVTSNSRTAEANWLPWHAPGAAWPVELPLPHLDVVTGHLTVPLLTPVQILEGAQFEYEILRTPSLEALVIDEPLVGPATLQTDLLESSGVSWSMLDAPIGQNSVFFPDRYTLILRQVKRGTGGEIVAQSPALKLTFFSSVDAEQLQEAWNAITLDPLVVVDGPEPGDTGGTSGGAGAPPGGIQP